MSVEELACDEVKKERKEAQKKNLESSVKTAEKTEVIISMGKNDSMMRMKESGEKELVIEVFFFFFFSSFFFFLQMPHTLPFLGC